MKMQQCPNGHFYDAEKSAICPYCTTEPLGRTVGYEQSDIRKTVGVTGEYEMSKTMGISNNYDIGKTVALDNIEEDNDIGKTVAIFQKKYNSKIDPVVGWLVCTSGASKEVDYKIHSDNNFIGRSKNMDICIEDDATISRENHAIISFDTKYKKFYFSPGEGRAIVRVNKQSIFNTVQLQNYDVIEIGDTVFMFIAFCGEQFSWD